MKKTSEITWRKPTLAERSALKNAALAVVKKMGRPKKPLKEKGIRISLVLSPIVISSYKLRAKKTGKGYQTLISEDLAKSAKK